MKKVLSKKPLLKRKKVKPLAYWQKKCDKLLQEIIGRMYDKCLLCNQPISAGHHFILKSQSTELRYNIKNIIPVCVRHHCLIHQGMDDTVVGEIIKIKGFNWLEELKSIKKQSIGKQYGRVYYEEMFKRLSLLTPYKVKI